MQTGGMDTQQQLDGFKTPFGGLNSVIAGTQSTVRRGQIVMNSLLSC